MTLNKTLQFEPADPKYITRIESSKQRRVYRKADLAKGDASKVEIQTQQAVIDWQDHRVKRRNHGLFVNR